MGSVKQLFLSHAKFKCNSNNKNTLHGKRRPVPGNDGVPDDRAKRQRLDGFTLEFPIVAGRNLVSSGQHTRPKTPCKDASALLEIFSDLRLKPSSPPKAVMDSSSDISKNTQHPMIESNSRTKDGDSRHRCTFKEKCMTPAWYAQYDRLKLFLEKNGNRYPVRRSDKSKQEQSIAAWAQLQRSRFLKSGNNYLTADAKNLLEQLPGWWWNQKRPSTVKEGHDGSKIESTEPGTVSGHHNVSLVDDAWLESYYDLVIFMEDHPGSYPALVGKWKDLRKWTDQQRKERVRGTLTDRKMLLLEAVPGWRRR
jgi:hypothetical protein